MKVPTILRYEYYHCIKKGEPRCSQSVTSTTDLEQQILAYLGQLAVSERVLNWAEASLAELQKDRRAQQQDARESQRNAYDACLARLQNLVDLKTAPANINGSLLSDEEHQKQRMRLLQEKEKLEAIRVTDTRADEPIWAVKDILTMTARAKEKFKAGDATAKRRILSAVGSNLTLNDKKLSIDARIPFRIIGETMPGISQVFEPIEPEKNAAKSTRTGQEPPEITLLSGRRTDVRTWKGRVRIMVHKLYEYFLEHPDEPSPTFDEPPERFPWREAA